MIVPKIEADPAMVPVLSEDELVDLCKVIEDHEQGGGDLDQGSVPSVEINDVIQAQCYPFRKLCDVRVAGVTRDVAENVLYGPICGVHLVVSDEPFKE